MVGKSVATFLVLGLLSAMFEPLISTYLRSGLAWNANEIAFYYAVLFPCSFCFSLVIPYLADRATNRKPVLLATSVVAAGAYAGFALTDGFWPTVLISALLLAPAASLSAQLFSYMSRCRNGTVNAVALRGVFAFAWVVGPTIATTIVADYGFDHLFWLLAGLAILLFALTANLTNPGDGAEVGVQARPTTMNPKMIWLMFLAFAFLQGGNAVALMALPILIVEQLDRPVSDVGLVFAVCAALEVPMFILVSRLMKRLSLTTILLTGTAIGLAYYVVVSSTDSFTVILLAQALNAAFVATIFGAGMAWFQSSIPQMPGLATGLFMNSYRVGAASFVPLAAIVSGNAGDDFKAALVLAAGVTLVALVLLAAPLIFTKPAADSQT